MANESNLVMISSTVHSDSGVWNWMVPLKILASSLSVCWKSATWYTVDWVDRLVMTA